MSVYIGVADVVGALSHNQKVGWLLVGAYTKVVGSVPVWVYMVPAKEPIRDSLSHQCFSLTSMFLSFPLSLKQSEKNGLGWG